MNDNLLIVHGGAPTAVMNASLYGAIRQARASGAVDGIFGAENGSAAIASGNWIDLGALPSETLEALPNTPASFIGTSRFPLEEDGYEKIVDTLVEKNIRYLLFNGGNGSMDTCGKIVQALARRVPGSGIKVVGIPKTIDNDIAVTDHSPGFGSAARYLAASTAELAQDIASLPIHVCVIESMGRNAGWLTAASVLAKDSLRDAAGRMDGFGRNARSPLGPHLVYVPEIPFDEEAFLDEAGSLYKKFGGVVVVASEGLKDASGKPIVPPIFQTGRSVYYGDVSAHLANLVIMRLGIKARNEKPGVLGRCSIAHQSPVDRAEAILAGEEAVKAALEGQTGVMVGFRRISPEPYRCETFLIPLEEVMLHERSLPLEYLNADRNGIDDAFVQWCRPLAGGALAPFAGRF